MKFTGRTSGSEVDLDHVIKRLWRHTDIETVPGCWLWTKPGADGYGHIYINNRPLKVHRVAKLIIHGFDQSLELDHLCRNHACWNPDHLEPVTHRVNVLRGVGLAAINAAKSLCIRGHELTPVVRGNGRRRRVCRTCSRDSYMRSRERLAGAA